MSDEHREIEVVEVGSGPVKPGRPPRTIDRTDLLLTLLVVGVFIGAACSAFTAWTVYQQTEDQRALNCIYMTSGSGDEREYEELADFERQIADTFDCDVKGR